MAMRTYRYPHWTILVLGALSWGVLRAAVRLMIDGDDSASVPMAVFANIGPLTVLLYFFLRAIGKPPRFGYLIADPKSAGLATFVAIMVYCVPDFIFTGTSVIGVLYVLSLSSFIGAIVYFTMRRKIEESVPDSPEGL